MKLLSPHKVLHRVTDPLHNRLVLKSKHYQNWHNFEHHRRIHFGVLAAYVIVICTVIANQFGPALTKAANQTWDLGTAGDYTYDNTKMNITGGTASLKNSNIAGTNWIANDSNGYSWQYRKAITIDNTAGGALTDYQVNLTDMSSITLGYWKMDEASGQSLADSSGNGNTATATGTTVADAVYNKGRVFNGTSDYVQLPTIANIRSISFWVRATGSNYLLDARTGLANGYFYSGGVGSGLTKVYVNGNSASLAWSSLPINSWAHIYLEATANFTDNINLMSRYTNLEFLSGSLDEVRVFSRALTTTEITSLAQTNSLPLARLGSVYTRSASDGSDLRFTDSDGTSALSYWIQSYNQADQSSSIWIKIPSISAASTKTIYLYYGNTHSPPSVSSGANTFDVFDDFNDGDINGWTVTKEGSTGGGVAVVNGEAVMSGAASLYLQFMKDTPSNLQDFVYESDVKPYDGSGNNMMQAGMTLRSPDTNNLYCTGFDLWESVSTAVIGKRVAGGWTQISSTANTHPSGSYYRFKTSISGTAIKFYINDYLAISSTDSSLSAGGKIGFNYDFGNAGATDTMTVDNIRVRKYTAVEPTIVLSGIGSESAFANYPVTRSPGAYWIANDGSNIWLYRKTITISKANVNSTLTNFPLKVEISSDSDIGAHAKSDLTDLRFTSDDFVTVLPAEQESGSVAAGVASGIFWVQVPSISSTADTTIYVYYGNSSATAQANPATVWDNDFKGVWHFKNGSTLSGLDSTQNAKNLTISGPTAGTGIIDGDMVNAGSTNMATQSARLFTETQTNFTMTSWVKWTGTGRYIWSQFNNSNGLALQQSGSNTDLTTVIYVNGVSVGAATLISNFFTTFANTWVKLDLVFNGSNYLIYVNGVYATRDTGTQWATLNDSSAHFMWGNRTDSTRGWVGGIDEGRASFTNRSAEWIKFEYYNQKDTAGQLTFGAQTQTSLSPTLTPSTTQGYSVVSGFSQTLGSGSAGTIKYQVSPDSGSSWYWWNGSAWALTTAGYAESNLASDINTHFADSSFDAIGSAPKHFVWRAYFVSDGTQNPILDGITLSYTWDTLAPPNPTTLSSAKSQKTGGIDITSGNWAGSANPYFTWAAPTDGANPGEQASGISGYYIYFGPIDVGGGCTSTPYSSRGLATDTGGGKHWQTATTFEVGVDSSAMTTSTTYCLSIQTKDIAENLQLTPTVLFASYKYDANNPDSPAYVSVNPSSYSRVNSYIFTWPVTGADMATDTGGSDLAKYQYKVGPSGTWTDVPGDLNTNTITPATPAYQTGANYFYLRAVDTAGNADPTPSQTTFFFNDSAPTTPRALTANPGASSTNAFSFSWNLPKSYNAAIAGYYYSINQLPTLANASYTTSRSLPEGPYATQQGDNVIYVVAKDEAGNADLSGCSHVTGNEDTDTCAKTTFIANTAAPGQPTGLSLVDGSNRDKQQYKIFLTWVEPAQKGTGFVGYAIYRSTDNSNFTKIGETSGNTYADVNLSSIPYYYYIKSRDNAGQFSAASDSPALTLTPTGRYTSPPLLADGPTSQTKAFSTTISWETDREASSFIEFGKDKDHLGIANGGGTTGKLERTLKHSVIVDGLDPETDYYYQAVWLDSDGNRGQQSGLSFRTGLRPRILNVQISNITLSSATLSWSTTNPSTATLNFGLTNNYGNTNNTLQSSQTTNHSLTLNDLNDSTTYHFQITGEDTDSNFLTSDDYHFSTLIRPVIQNAEIETVPEAPTTTIKVTFTTNVPTTTIVDYTPDKDTKTLTKSDANPTTSHTLTISDLADQTRYKLRAYGIDDFGNLAETTSFQSQNNQSISYFDTPKDSRPPKVSNLNIEVKAQGVSDTQKAQIVASWETDEPATSFMDFGQGITGDSYPQQTQEDKTLSNSHVVIAGELEPSKIYHIRVGSHDQAGNTGYSGDTTVITGKIQRSVMDLIIQSLEKSLGWLFGLSFSK